jgi:hypothetical protein
MFSLLFFLLLPFILILPLSSLDYLLPIIAGFYVCIFITVFFFIKKNIKVNYWVLLSIYIYIFTFALVLGYIAYLSKQYELVSFSFCFY